MSLFSMITFPAEAQISPQGVIEIEQGGKLWIEGSASIVDYRCQAERLSGNGTIENTGNPQENVKGHGAVTISVSIPVYSLECGRKAMNNDMYKALKAGEYPSISYKLLHAILVDSTTSSIDQKNDWMSIKTTGVLEIAGIQDTTQVYVKGKLLSDDRFRVKGSKQISMKTYDIKPPTALLGLIKASNKLTVYFDVTVRLKSS
ncbi:hypothetical protein NC796_09860 [Aliifodinibius sp. S!AR15-10]|nr:hypothetical protein [Aliifodinibius sp. S!AR15-10]